VLPVAGTGISVTDALRVPLGCSDEIAARAERLQTTLGEGPCLAATALAEPLILNWDQVLQRWPIFAAKLEEETQLRSVASLPLHSADPGRGGGSGPWTCT
jgi:hypothetical protein